MKKRLEAELISIAHRILKLKNKAEVDQLYIESKKLYETLTILKFYGDNYETIKSEIPQEEIEEKITVLLEKEEAKKVEEKTTIEEKLENTPEIEKTIEEIEEVETETKEIIAEEKAEEIEVKVEEIEEKTENFDGIFELASKEIEVEDVQDEVEKTEPKQFSFDELMGENYTEPVFVKPTEIKKKEEKETTETSIIVDKKEEKTQSLNDKLAKGINIGLNDRIAFVKQLFGESNEDYNRVLSQLNTFDSFEDAKTFIDEMVKPDYNNWDGKDDYAARFVEIIEKKFA